MTIKWASRGSEASKEFEKENAARQARRDQQTKTWRFMLKPEEEARVTFVDGDLDENGVLDMLVYPQHQLFMNGSWFNFFVCVEKQEPCPICESGDRPSLVAICTVIDHRKIQSNKDKSKVYTNQKRLFVAKHNTFKILQNIASKRGGLAGCTFDILRAGEKDPVVGSQFDFIEKGKLETLKAKYIEKSAEGKLVSIFAPLDYEKEIDYRTATELKKLGFGSGVPVGHEDSAPWGDTSTDYSKEM